MGDVTVCLVADLWYNERLWVKDQSPWKGEGRGLRGGWGSWLLAHAEEGAEKLISGDPEARSFKIKIPICGLLRRFVSITKGEQRGLGLSFNNCILLSLNVTLSVKSPPRICVIACIVAVSFDSFAYAVTFEWMYNFKYGKSSAELGAGSLGTVSPDFEP